jgi:hypothetical protein
VEFYLHDIMAWCLNMHWMLRILQDENDCNDCFKGLVIALQTAKWTQCCQPLSKINSLMKACRSITKPYKNER